MDDLGQVGTVVNQNHVPQLLGHPFPSFSWYCPFRLGNPALLDPPIAKGSQKAGDFMRNLPRFLFKNTLKAKKKKMSVGPFLGTGCRFEISLQEISLRCITGREAILKQKTVT